MKALKTGKIKTEDFALVKKMVSQGNVTSVKLRFALFQWKWVYVVKFVTE